MNRRDFCRHGLALGALLAASPTAAQLLSGAGAVLDVRSFGALGDGLRDDTAALQRALDAAPEGATVLVPRTRAFYRISAPLVVRQGITVLSADGAELRQTTPGAGAVQVEAAGVEIRGLTLTGTQFVRTVYTECGVRATGPSARRPIRGLTVAGCRIQAWGGYGVLLRYVDGFRVEGCGIERVNYGGVLGFSARNGTVAGNRVETVPGSPLTSGNAYGIGMTRAGGGDLERDPRSANVSITGNVVRGVAGWEGIDTHGGQGISITRNVVTGCRVGIMCTSVPVGGREVLAPLDCVVQGNVVDSGRRDGRAWTGIGFIGAAPPSGPVQEAATGAITGNLVRGHGPADTVSGAILCRSTRGLLIRGNTLEEPSPFGICLWYQNEDARVLENTIVDAWTDAGSAAGGIVLRDRHNVALVEGNAFLRTPRSPRAHSPHYFESAVQVSGPESSATVRGNRNEAPTELRSTVPGSNVRRGISSR
ncbi:MAG: hypothetical protein JWM27_1557 [Gemmatimonadetes bacterium]|nr:hypothetical protein [Gemmatimonadota bacterium]